jgi:hypothetical protein
VDGSGEIKESFLINEMGASHSSGSDSEVEDDDTGLGLEDVQERCLVAVTKSLGDGVQRLVIFRRASDDGCELFAVWIDNASNTPRYARVSVSREDRMKLEETFESADIYKLALHEVTKLEPVTDFASTVSAILSDHGAVTVVGDTNVFTGATLECSTTESS